MPNQDESQGQDPSQDRYGDNSVDEEAFGSMLEISNVRVAPHIQNQWFVHVSFSPVSSHGFNHTVQE